MKISKELKKILKFIQPSMLVGGYVRDSILGVETNDVDIVTLLKPNEVTEILTKKGIKVIPTGIKHGTVTAIYNNQVFEITTARKDIKTDGRHAEVEFSLSFEEDAMRRDFTFNALYIKPNGEIIDFTDGIEDLKAGKIKFIGAASARIDEDYLRILRFFRFYARFAKQPVEHELLKTLKNKSSLLRKLSAERITAEVLKILTISDITDTLDIMSKTDTLKNIGLNGDIHQTSSLPVNPMLRLYNLGGETIIKNSCFVFSNQQLKYFKQLMRSKNIPFSDENLAEKSYFVGQDICIDTLELLAVRTGDNQYNKWADKVKKMELQTFPVTGADLIKLNFQEGSELGLLLKKAEQWWAQNKFPSKEDVIKYIMN